MIYSFLFKNSIRVMALSLMLGGFSSTRAFATSGDKKSLLSTLLYNYLIRNPLANELSNRCQPVAKANAVLKAKVFLFKQTTNGCEKPSAHDLSTAYKGVITHLRQDSRQGHHDQENQQFPNPQVNIEYRTNYNSRSPQPIVEGDPFFDILRLAFVGDAVLDQALTEIMQQNNERYENVRQLRSNLSLCESFSRIINKENLCSNKGEQKFAADLVEASLAEIYFTKGYETAKNVVEKLMIVNQQSEVASIQSDSYQRIFPEEKNRRDVSTKDVQLISDFLLAYLSHPDS